MEQAKTAEEKFLDQFRRLIAREMDRKTGPDDSSQKAWTKEEWKGKNWISKMSLLKKSKRISKCAGLTKGGSVLIQLVHNQSLVLTALADARTAAQL